MGQEKGRELLDHSRATRWRAVPDGGVDLGGEFGKGGARRHFRRNPLRIRSVLECELHAMVVKILYIDDALYRSLVPRYHAQHTEKISKFGRLDVAHVPAAANRR
jgi:hypothetical protein